MCFRNMTSSNALLDSVISQHRTHNIEHTPHRHQTEKFSNMSEVDNFVCQVALTLQVLPSCDNTLLILALFQ